MGGTYFHQSQCENIPNQFVEGFAYHRECYKQFTRAINDLKKREESASSESSSTSSSSSTVGSSGSSVARPKRCHEKDSAGRFPSYRMICKKVEKRIRTRDRETKELPSKFTLEARVQTFHKTVELRHDKDMSDAIAGVDLLVKDFMKHESRMKNYTSIVRVNDKSASHEKIDEWVLVRQSIDETVIENGVCISLDTLLELKGIQKKDHQTRHNLKSRLERNYGNKLFF